MTIINRSLHIVAYADNAVIISRNVMYLGEALPQFMKPAAVMVLKINAENTRYMIRTKPAKRISMCNMSLNQVQSKG